MLPPGPNLAMLLLGGWRRLVEGAVAELTALGYEDVGPSYHFAMRAIDSGADSASELGRRTAVSKQAAAKTVDVLIARGYVAREPDPADARRKLLRVTPLGHRVMEDGEQIFNRLRDDFARQIGHEELAAFEAALVTLVGDEAVRPDAPGWAASS